MGHFHLFHTYEQFEHVGGEYELLAREENVNVEYEFIGELRCQPHEIVSNQSS